MSPCLRCLCGESASHPTLHAGRRLGSHMLPRLRTPHDAYFELLRWGPSANSSVNRRAKPPSLARLDDVVTYSVLPMDATIPCRRADRCMSIGPLSRSQKLLEPFARHRSAGSRSLGIPPIHLPGVLYIAAYC